MSWNRSKLKVDYCIPFKPFRIFKLPVIAIYLLLEGQEGETDSELNVRLATGEHVVHGAALYQLASLMNHSCSSNVERAWPPTSARATWIASQNISAGEELTIEYISLEEAGSARTRRQVLLNKYGFVCMGSCEECSLPKEEQVLHRSVEFD